MKHTRISLITYNIWNTVKWPEREKALTSFLKKFLPDILCLQELREETLVAIKDCLADHDHVKDEKKGWVIESNIFWNKNHFSEVEHGFEKLEIPEKDRGLFWVRLQLLNTNKTILIATAHFTWQGHYLEIESGISPRHKQTLQTIEHLKRIAKPLEPVFFMGDLNDPTVPNRYFPNAGYTSCFSELNLLTPTTHPAQPTADFLTANQAIDWIFSNDQSRALSACVPQFYLDGIAPSDHWPVQAIYEIATE